VKNIPLLPANSLAALNDFLEVHSSTTSLFSYTPFYLPK
jgi:hypothetical protein